jgi:hypothetical protein
MEQVYDPISDPNFAVPNYLYLDAFDTAKQLYRTIPFDFTIDATGNYNSTSFGMVAQNSFDASSNPIKVWKFNITRYVQNFLTQREPLYDLRLTAPYLLKDIYRSGATSSSDVDQYFSFNPDILAGRVRLGGGNHPTQRMRLRIIYTKI